MPKKKVFPTTMTRTGDVVIDDKNTVYVVKAEDSHALTLYQLPDMHEVQLERHLAVATTLFVVVRDGTIYCPPMPAC